MPDIKKIEKATVWALASILATILLGLPALYYTVKEPKPHVSYRLIGQANVLDVHKPLKDLTVLYRGENIREQRKNLRIFTLVVQNDGDTDIRQTDFDQTKCWGVKIENAEIVELPRIVDSNSDYLRENVVPQASTNNIVEFNKVIFERRKYFTVEIQVIHSSNQEPSLKPLGKITGIDAMAYLDACSLATELSFWKRVFYGNTTVQVVRVIILGVAGIIFALLAIILLVIILDAKTDRKRKREKAACNDLFNNYLSPLIGGKDAQSQQLIKYLITRTRCNVKELKEMREILTNKKVLKSMASIMKERKALISYLPNDFDLGSIRIPSMLVDRNLSNENGFSVKPSILETLDNCISYAETHQPPKELLHPEYYDSSFRFDDDLKISTSKTESYEDYI